MKANSVILVFSIMLVLLFTYTAVSKVLDYETFRGQMLNQPLPSSLSSQLAWAVPLIELIIAVLLIIKNTRLIGFVLSLVLMTAFTIYVGLIIANTFNRVPCSCGGIMESLSWEGHLAVNLFFLLLSMTGLLLEIRKKRDCTISSHTISRSPPYTSQGQAKGES
jgi:putative oxidoreductase